MSAETAKRRSDARNHHFVPQFYLKGFARLRSKDAQLTAFNLATGDQFVTRPRNVAAKRDYNRVDIEGVDPNFVETEMSKIEGDLDAAFKRIIDTESIEDRDDLSWVLVLISRLAVTTPAFRDQRDKIMADVAKKMIQMSLRTEETWTSVLSGMPDEMKRKPAIPYAEMKKAIDTGAIYPVTSKDALIAQEVQLWADVMPIIEARKWTLMISNNAIGNFATSDRPVSLRWDDESMNRNNYGVGLGMRKTTLIFPLSRHLAVSGSFEYDNGVVPASPELVAQINLRTFMGAEKQVYAPDDFPMVDKDRAIRPFSETMIWKEIRTRTSEAKIANT